MMFKVGDTVSVSKMVLSEDEQIFPHGTIVEIRDDSRVVVELLYTALRVEVEVQNLRPRKLKSQ